MSPPKPPASRDGVAPGRAMALARYSRVAIALHWAIGGLILLNAALGWRVAILTGAARSAVFPWHKSVGITVLVLSLLRLVWRLLHPPPAYPAAMTGLERAAATTVHGLLYAVMIGLPLTGWMEVSASPMNRPMLLYELLPWPQVPFVRDLPLDVRKPLAARLLIGHVWLAWSGLTLIALHVAAALKHQFWDRDQVLTRMLPRLRAAAGADQ